MLTLDPEAKHLTSNPNPMESAMSNYKTPTYGTERLTYKGKTWTAGDLVRPPNSGIGFNTCMIVGFGKSEFDWGGKKGVEVTWYARLARPYGAGQCVGTTGPGMLTSAEVYEIPIERLLEWDHKAEKHGGHITRCTTCSPLNHTAEVK